LPDIADGLEIDGQPVQTYEQGDVNTQDGFEDALGRAAGIETPERPRDAQGRFVSTQEAPPETEAEPIEAPDEEIPVEPDEEEEDVSEWQVRYEEMRRQYDDLYSAYGRQTGELGELRQQQVPASEPIVDVEAMIQQHGGADVLEWATKNSPGHIDEAARAWAMSGDPEGAVFYADYRAEQARLEYGAQMRQSQIAPDPTMAQMSTERKLTEIWRERRQNDPDFASYEAGIGPALSSASTPDEIKLMIVSGDAEHMRQGVNFLKPYAQLEAYKTGASQETPQPQAAAEEARKEAVRRTAIVSGSQRLSDAGADLSDGEMSSEQRIAKFKDMFEETSSTDIASGLTINGKPVLPPRPSRS
jgi:hypothetical protein